MGDFWMKWIETNPFKRDYAKVHSWGMEYELALDVKFGLDWRLVKQGDFIILVHPDEPEMLQLAQVVQEPDDMNGGKEFYRYVYNVEPFMRAGLGGRPGFMRMTLKRRRIDYPFTEVVRSFTAGKPEDWTGNRLHMPYLEDKFFI